MKDFNAKELGMKEWTLGEDLSRQANLLDQITFDDIITAVKCNCKKVDYFTVENQLKAFLAMRMTDMWDLFGINVDKIIEIVKEERQG